MPAEMKDRQQNAPLRHLMVVFFYFSIFDVWVAVNSVRSTELGNSPLLNNTELGFVLV